MNLQAVKIFILLLAFVLLVSGQESSFALKTADSQFDASKAQIVEYCKLMSKPKDYVGKLIRLEAVLLHHGNSEITLYVECEPKLSELLIDFVSDKRDVLFDDLWSKTNVMEVKDDGRVTTWRMRNAKVTVVGMFLGPDKPDSKFGYGHYGWSKYMFEIHAFEKLERVQEKK